MRHINKVASIIILVALAACNKGSLVSPSSELPPLAASSSKAIASVSRGSLIAGNVGSSWLTVFVNGSAWEAIPPSGSSVMDLDPGLYLVTFEPSDRFVESASGIELADCTYTDLMIIAGRETSAYCAE